jgi:hypothetical protein
MQQLSGHVAIVDDDASLREALARLLREPVPSSMV